MPFGRGGGGDGTRRRISFTAKVKIDKPAEWAEMFDDAWRTMKYRFYDSQMHGKDWDAMRAKYQPLVADIGDRQELLNIINEMIGELNASHTGAAQGGGGGEARVQTSHLGIELESDEQAGRYRVSHVYENGPTDKDWVKVSVGDYLLAIGGKPVKAGDNFWSLLASHNRLNRKIAVKFNNKPTDEGAWQTRIEPISTGLQPTPLRTLGQTARRDGGQTLERPDRIPAHPGDEPAVLAQVRKRDSRKPQQRSPRH